MIIARVVLADYFIATRDCRNFRRPPAKNDGRHLFDSIVAHPGPMPGHSRGRKDHQEFVVFDSAQAYPAFVVYYSL